MSRLIVTFGNCQAQAVSTLLPSVLPKAKLRFLPFPKRLPAAHSVVHCNNNPRTGAMADTQEILKTVAQADVLFYQPLGDHHGELAESKILPLLKSNCVAVSYPYLFNSGMYSLCHAPYAAKQAYGTIYGEEILMKSMASYGVDRTKRDYLAGKIDFQLPQRYAHCLGEIRLREVQSAIQVSDFLVEHHQSRKLFFTHNHPTTFVFAEILRQFAQLADLPLRLDRLNVAQENAAQLAETNCPISPYDIEAHGYHFAGTPKWQEQGQELIRMVAGVFIKQSAGPKRRAA